MHVRRDNGIHEEGSDTPCVRVCRVDDHSLAAPYGQHRPADGLRRGGRYTLLLEVGDDVGVRHRRLARPKREGYTTHNEATGIFALESARSIAETALRT